MSNMHKTITNKATKRTVHVYAIVTKTKTNHGRPFGRKNRVTTTTVKRRTGLR